MFLKQDDDGNIYQTDPAFNGEVGKSLVPEMVEDGNVAILSVKEDKDVVADRKRYAKQMQKQAQAQQAEAARRHKRAQKLQNAWAKKADKLYSVNNRLSKALEMRRHLAKEHALMQNYNDYEVVSGVSGWGYSADGRKPYLDHPARDYQYIEEVSEDFGNTLSASVPSGLIVGTFSQQALQAKKAAMAPKAPLIKATPQAEPAKSVTVIPDTPESAVQKASHASKFAHPMLVFGLVPTRAK